VSEHEEEMFEDDPAEYIRRDLEPSTESDTRRQAATEFTQALMANFETEVTNIIKGYVTSFLSVSQQGKARKLTTAIRPEPDCQLEGQGHRHLPPYLHCRQGIYCSGEFGILADTNSQRGVTSVNVLVDVVKFFGENVFGDLQAAPGSVHPILTVDAIKYLYTFRNQVCTTALV
jgi:exportin-2 (importin alpha re-exporter)